MSEHTADYDAPAVEVWDGSVPPGGFVCSRCGWPTESEPCEHLSTALPDHMDWDGPCDHRAAWDAVTTHTRTVNGVGPDHCAECSGAIQEWVPWPCPRVTPPEA